MVKGPQKPAIDLTEYRESEPIDLSSAELEALLELVPGMSSRPEGGAFKVNPGGVVGVGDVAGRRLVINPKVDIERLMFLVSYSLDPVRWQESIPVLGKDQDLLSAIAPMFVHAVRRATRRGVLCGYQERSEALTTVRGRIEFDQLVKVRHGQIFPIDCRFDDYTVDIELNRMLLAATERLLGLGRLGPHWLQELRKLLPLFAQVTHERYQRHAVPSPTFTRLNQHYRPAIKLAQLILQNLSIEVSVPTVSGRGFFLNMATIFEDFVRISLREALDLPERQFPQGARGHRLHLDRGRRVKLEPDLSWWDEERCLFVGDAKYKVTPPAAGVKNPDIYQLLAYAQATALPCGLLIYAAGEAEATKYEISHSDMLFEVRTLDLDRTPEVILRQIGDLAGTVRAMARRATGLSTALPAETTKQVVRAA